MTVSANRYTIELKGQESLTRNNLEKTMKLKVFGVEDLSYYEPDAQVVLLSDAEEEIERLREENKKLKGRLSELCSAISTVNEVVNRR